MADLVLNTLKISNVVLKWTNTHQKLIDTTLFMNIIFYCIQKKKGKRAAEGSALHD